MTLDDDTLAGATRGRLYLWAQELDIRGRGSMSRDELAAALRAARPDWFSPPNACRSMVISSCGRHSPAAATAKRAAGPAASSC